MSELRRSYEEHGYCIAPGVLGQAEVADLLSEADRLHALGASFRETSVDGAIKWLLVSRPQEPPILRGVQSPYKVSGAIDRVRTSPRLFEALRLLTGPDLATVVSTLFWKPPSKADTAIAYHQDAALRRPPERYRNLAASYVQVGIALDPHGPENGGMCVIPGSHLLGDLAIKRDTSIMLDAPDVFDLAQFGLDRGREVDIRLRPGAAILWHPYLLHGSPPNRSATLNRRFLVFGYMRIEDCDDCVPAYRDGRACPFPQP